MACEKRLKRSRSDLDVTLPFFVGCSFRRLCPYTRRDFGAWRPLCRPDEYVARIKDADEYFITNPKSRTFKGVGRESDTATVSPLG